MLITKKVFKDFILLKQNKSLYWKWQVIIHTESLNYSPLQEAASISTLSNHLASYGIKKSTSFIVVLIKNCTKWLIYQTFDFVLINDFPWFMSLTTDLFWELFIGTHRALCKDFGYHLHNFNPFESSIFVTSIQTICCNEQRT